MFAAHCLGVCPLRIFLTGNKKTFQLNMDEREICAARLKVVCVCVCVA